MIANRIINNEEKWSAVADEITAHGGDGKAVSEALKELYSVYTEDMIFPSRGQIPSGIILPQEQSKIMCENRKETVK